MVSRKVRLAEQSVAASRMLRNYTLTRALCHDPNKCASKIRTRSHSELLGLHGGIFNFGNGFLLIVVVLQQNPSLKSIEEYMINEKTSSACDDPFDLHRFLLAQENSYDSVLSELRNGQKRTHWMWYVFPQLVGLGNSEISKHYAVKSVEEARHYLAHPILGKRILECAETVLAIQKRPISEIFGYPDDLKLKSSMTLFLFASNSRSVFSKVIEKYFNRERDERTLKILETLK
ncbi:MAG: DUF1810 domain-containing protein [Candidatus Ozemobacteraceae bacterium]